MPQKLRWGFMGAGKVARDHGCVIDLLQDNNQITAIADVVPEYAADLASKLNVSTSCSPEELVRRDDIDIVYVATPHRHHYQCTMAALEAGKNVLCEKPFGVNAKEAKAMIRKAQEKGVFVAENMWSASFPATIEMKRLIRDGAIGEPRIVDVSYYVDDFAPSTWRPVAENAYGGGILERAMYMTYFVSSIFDDEPEKVSASGIVTQQGRDDAFFATVFYPGGKVASIRNSIRVPGGPHATIYGSSGSICDIDVFHQPLQFKCNDKLYQFPLDSIGRPRVPYNFEPQRREAFRYTVAHVYECISNGKTEAPLLPHSTTIKSMELLDRIRAQIGVQYDEDETRL